MLVLKRKCEQSVIVGHPESGEPLMTVTVLEISSSRVSLGFTALADVPIHRSEVWKQMNGNLKTNGRSDGSVTLEKLHMERRPSEGPGGCPFEEGPAMA
jgi:carbon storage regulator CsrA